jgi:hypothetical protein
MIAKFSFLVTFVRALTPRMIYRLEDIIEIGLKETEYDCIDYIDRTELTWDKVQRRAM